jgi:hypothetical protein
VDLRSCLVRFSRRSVVLQSFLDHLDARLSVDQQYFHRVRCPVHQTLAQVPPVDLTGDPRHSLPLVGHRSFLAARLDLRGPVERRSFLAARLDLRGPVERRSFLAARLDLQGPVERRSFLAARLDLQGPVGRRSFLAARLDLLGPVGHRSFPAARLDLLGPVGHRSFPAALGRIVSAFADRTVQVVYS